ncbi:hypothetical protein Afil01_44640 [Actinorhabdospora filicis]|uniref:Mini-circle protein n=1 Tax=Actinorhabdospora filicis TaxID=1785913 RepID=A0A9W6W4U8_9ACTN|nr:DinB family protein [Actinorhabdospora filicis]GLZ79657.1 hypothetical protein Afil01_44640 [Actinorhabdospora filicis]
MTSDRPEAPLTGDERSLLTGFLDYQRATLAMKCHGVSADDLRAPTVAPSALTLQGLVQHASDCERGWFQQIMGGRDEPDLYGAPKDFADLTADFATVRATWEHECERSRATVAALDLDAVGVAGDETFSLRWVLIHMIEEYARHNGHADLLRERIDGVTGE